MEPKNAEAGPTAVEVEAVTLKADQPFFVHDPRNEPDLEFGCLLMREIGAIAQTPAHQGQRIEW